MSRVLAVMFGVGGAAWLGLSLIIAATFSLEFGIVDGVRGALSAWPFTVGFATICGLGALGGFSPEDL